MLCVFGSCDDLEHCVRGSRWIGGPDGESRARECRETRALIDMTSGLGTLYVFILLHLNFPKLLKTLISTFIEI